MGAVDGLAEPLSRPAEARPNDASESEFESLFREYYGRVFSVLLRVVGERMCAEELATDVFWKLHSQPLSAPAWNNVGPWLYRTAVNAGIDAIRTTFRRKHYENAAAGTPSHDCNRIDPLESALRDEERRRVRAVLARMKPERAQILMLRASGCKYSEIAAALEVSPSGVGTLLHRAEQDFRKRYLAVAGKTEET